MTLNFPRLICDTHRGNRCVASVFPVPETIDEAGAADVALALAASQTVVLAKRPRRLDLLKLAMPPARAHFTMRVHRNQPFEFIEQNLAPFLSYARLQLDSTIYSAYDDALNFAIDTACDIEIISLDFDRYRNKFDTSELTSWLAERARFLSTQTSAPILVTNFAGTDDYASTVNRELAFAFANIPGVALCDVAAISKALGDDFFDERSVALKATRWSDAATVAIAREFALRWLPAVLLPPVKAVAVDLDATLYGGILGEDGIDGVSLDGGFKELQHHLVSLTERGVFIAGISRNEQSDVEELFARRTDMPLQRSHFSALIANWGDKAESIRTAAAQLRIGTDSIVFLDDNAGELAAVSSQSPEVRGLHAADPRMSMKALDYCPGLFRFATTSEDALRVSDLAANAARDTELANTDDVDRYLRSLQVQIRFRVNHPADFHRMHELSVKTNQFNTAIKRLSENEISQRITKGELIGVAFTLQDRLSESGTVGVVLAKSVVDGVIEIEEICISCRALGRKLEDTMISEAIILAGGPGARSVRIQFATGPRNQPARDWLTRFAKQQLQEAGVVDVSWDPELIRKHIADSPVEVIVEESDAV